MKLLMIRENETPKEYDDIVIKLKRCLSDSGLVSSIPSIDYIRPDGKYTDEYIEEMVNEMVQRVGAEHMMKQPLFDAVVLLRRLESSQEN
ncbi:MAG: hypothetical protein IJM34_08355 [Lachnospiraceae bacterium]|nr:hypothetical protein [Lachnospiraceae bacterium]